MITNKYSLALLTANKQPKAPEKVVQEKPVVEKPVQEKPVPEKKQVELEEIWKVMYQDEIWSFDAPNKVLRFISDNFADTKGVCIENIKTGVLYTKNKFIELFNEKKPENVEKVEINPVKLQVKETKKLIKFDELIDDSDDENDDSYNNQNSNQFPIDMNRINQPQAKNYNQYGNYNMWQQGGYERNEPQNQIPSKKQVFEDNRVNYKNEKEVINLNNKNYQVNKKEIKNPDSRMPNQNQKQYLDKPADNRYKTQQNDLYMREKDIYRVLDDSEEDNYDDIDYDQDAYAYNEYNRGQKNNNQPVPQVKKGNEKVQNMFENIGHPPAIHNNFIELEKLLDAYNITDHDTFLLELRRYISINKVTDIGFNVPNPGKNIDFQIDIDNSDNEVEHKMAQIQIDQCINKLLSEYVKLTISMIKKI